MEQYNKGTKMTHISVNRVWTSEETASKLTEHKSNSQEYKHITDLHMIILGISYLAFLTWVFTR